MSNRRVYFAHPMSSYDTQEEAAALRIMAQHFNSNEWDIINPNQPEHQHAARRLRRPFAYFEELVSGCDALCYLPFDDGKIGYGIKGEVDAIKTRKPDAELFEVDMNAQRIIAQSALDESRVIGRSETAARLTSNTARAV